MQNTSITAKPFHEFFLPSCLRNYIRIKSVGFSTITLMPNMCASPIAMLAQQCRGILSTRSASKLAGLSGWRKDKLTVGEGNQETIRTGSPGAAVVEPKAVSVIGAPLIYGQPLYGAEKAPAAIRNAGLRDVCTKLGWR